MTAVQYSATLHLTGRNTGVPVPPEVLERLGGGRRPAVEVEVNGYRYRSTVGSMGGHALVPLSAEHRAASGLRGGEAIEVSLALDTAPRDAPVPDDLAAALAEAGVTARFDVLAPSRRKAHVTAVESAKAPATRARRIEGIIAGLAD